MRPDGGRSGDVRTQDVGALVGVAAPHQDPGEQVSPFSCLSKPAAVCPYVAGRMPEDGLRGETNGAAMASGAGNRRGQEDARMCLLTRGTGKRRGAKDPGANTPWWTAT